MRCVTTTRFACSSLRRVYGLTPAYHSLGQWIESNDYRIVGPPGELFCGSVQNGDLTAEVLFPVPEKDQFPEWDQSSEANPDYFVSH